MGLGTGRLVRLLRKIVVLPRVAWSGCRVVGLLVRRLLRRRVDIRRLRWGLMLRLSPLLRLRLRTESLTLRLLVRLGLILLSVVTLIALIALKMLGWAC
jgi:hypothetical protein